MLSLSLLTRNLENVFIFQGSADQYCKKSNPDLKKDRSLNVRSLTHLRDGVTVQHLHRRHVWPLAVHQHLQGLTSQSGRVLRLKPLHNTNNEVTARTDQNRVLHVVPQQTGVVQRVLGFLHLGVHWALLHLVLQGLEQLV